MDSRERVFTCLDHQAPDRAPIDFWASKGTWSVIESGTGMDRAAFLDTHDVDFRYIEGPKYIGPPIGADTDIWGVTRRYVNVPTDHGEETYSEVNESPLRTAQTVDDIESYAGWPDPNHFDYSVVKQQCLDVRDAGRVAVFMGDRMNRISQLKPAMYIRGVDKILMDFALNPEIVHAIFGKLRSFYSSYIERILDAADGMIDIILTGDDYGQQTGLIVRPKMWDEFLADGFAEYMAAITAHGVKTMHHTCGDVRSIVGRLHESGLDILQSLQPEAYSDYFPEMKEQYGKTLCFQGGISIQQTMPRGTTKDIESEVRKRMEQLGSNGGYILCTAHNIQADVSLENILALMDAYQKYGQY